MRFKWRGLRRVSTLAEKAPGRAMSRSSKQPGGNADGHATTTDATTTEAAQRAPYVVLARKYRPRTFEDLIGQDAMVRTL